ncbi:MAG0110 family membrane protein [Mycoplasmopsis verecunda]|uniref:Inhibitor of apoptosis-promoting Bax1 n=1 Tax=Mycoplasmopsis verecunda TaxID=171291 RepID=A0A1T4M9C4_9BACT|nr:tetraspanin family protein [Mycoplasmopsis verecunda]WPB54502.1 tetraspanin family protein [Mycoplasmopsis verecunda]SJZ63521.1 hypothetical protein SAMN02745154_00657 [Mycoplasmopsis verecunda]
MNLTRQEQYGEINQKTEAMSSRVQYYSVILATFTLSLALMLSLSIGLSFWFSTEHFQIWYETNWSVVFGVVIGLLVFNVIFMWVISLSKSIILKFISLPIFIIFYGIMIAASFYMYFAYQGLEISTNTLPKMIAIMMIPAGVMVIAAILGLFNLVNIRLLWVFSTFLFIGFIITFIVSFFVYRAGWYTTVIGTLLISVNMIVSWWQIRKNADAAQYIGRKEMLSRAMTDGIILFINYAQLLWYIISLMMGGKRN